jgi:hydroxyacylglutathione hydrolase
VSGHLICTPDSGWQASPEWVAAFEWNGWQASSGIGGRLGPEYATSLQSIKKLFGSALCCHIKEEPHIGPSCPVDITFSEQTTHFSGIEVIPTPGHTDGSISFLYNSPQERIYLFTGDTFFQSNGRWGTIFFSQAGGSAEALIESLLIYRELNPEVVISSGSSEDSLPFVEITQEEWIEAIDENIQRLKK